MDIFTRMKKDQGTVTDLSVFKTRHTARSAAEQKPVEEENEEQKPAEMVMQPSEEKPSALPEANEVPSAENPVETESVSETTEPADAIEPVPVKSEKEDDTERVIQFKRPENLNEEASIKLEIELETAKSNLLPVFPIVRYLKNKCMADDAFAALVNDERKTLAKCFKYVSDEVKKALNSANGWLDDNEVYAYAETYYMTDEAVFEQIEAERKAAEEKRRSEVDAKRKEQEKKRKEAAAAKKKKEPKEVKTAITEVVQEVKEALEEPLQEPLQEQLSLL